MADLTVRIVGDDSKLRSGLKSAESTLGKFSGKVSGIGKGIAGGIFGGAALFAGFNALRGQLTDVFAEARESQKVGKLTAAVIKSTGGAAGVSAGQIGDLATSISNKIGVDDEAIQSNENLLLTFTNIRNEVGKGNDIFDQAAQTVQDMSAALGQDGKSSAIQLGKALNDPIKGITALSRVGVSFTKQQKDQIKALVESGDTLGAQKVILKELGREFGGAAVAATDPMQKLDVVIGNLKERVGLALLPVLDKAAQWLGKNMPKALEVLIRFVKSAGKWIGDNLVPILMKLWSGLQESLEGGKKLIADLAKTFGTSQGTILKVLAGIAAGLVLLAVAWNAGPGIIITGVVALVAALLYAYNHFEGFRNGVQATMEVVKTVIQTSVDVIRNVLNGLAAFWDAWGGRITDLTSGIFEGIKAYISGAIEVVRGIINVVMALIHGDWSQAWDGIKQILSGVWESIKGIVQAALTVLTSILSLAWLGIKNGAVIAWGGILDFFKTLPARIVGAVSGVGHALYDAGHDMIVSFWDGIKAAWNWLADKTTFKLPTFHIKGTHFDIGGGSVSLLPHLAQGAIVKARPGGTEVVVGEGGRDEAIVPLPSRFGPAPGSSARPMSVTLPLEIHTAATADDVLRVILSPRGKAAIRATYREYQDDNARPVGAPRR